MHNCCVLFLDYLATSVKVEMGWMGTLPLALLGYKVLV